MIAHRSSHPAGLLQTRLSSLILHQNGNMTINPCPLTRNVRTLPRTPRPGITTRQSRQQPGASPEPIEIEDLRALVVPVRASASWAPEMSPEGGPAPYPSMGEVSSAMWCEYDDDDDDDSGSDRGSSEDSSGDGDRERAATVRRRASKSSRHRDRRRLLRVSVRSLDGHVCDDEDEDSDTDDGESETDGEDETDADDEGGGRAMSGRSLRWGRRGRSSHPSRGSGEGRRGAGSRWKRASKREEETFDEIDCQRKEELASVLRRLRVAIRRMDGVLTEEKVWF